MNNEVTLPDGTLVDIETASIDELEAAMEQCATEREKWNGLLLEVATLVEIKQEEQQWERKEMDQQKRRLQYLEETRR